MASAGRRAPVVALRCLRAAAGPVGAPTAAPQQQLRALAVAAQQQLAQQQQQQQQQHQEQQQQSRGGWWRIARTAAAAAGVALAAGATTAAADARAPAAEPAADAGSVKAAGEGAEQLPEFDADEVARHRTPASRVWVTFGDGVFDITDFITQHPGGAAKIMLAAGGAVEPFWSLYQQHRKQEIRDILERYRIGRLKGGAPAAARQQQGSADDPYANEPPRHPALLVRSARPFNGETPPELLAAAPLTPTDMFYVRHHLPVPALDDAAFTVTVEGAGLRALTLSVPELRARFKKAEVAATVQCAGNRRAEMKAQPAPGGSGHTIKGLDWDAGAIGTALWGGVRLRDVLLAAGLRPGDPDVAHVHFYGRDVDESGTPYAASIPLAKALAEGGDVLLAWEMNGEPLPRDHGGPLRVIVPGTTGARSVKWVGRVVASADECQGHWQQRDYKAFSPGADWDNLDWSSAPAIQEMPVTSAICEPPPNTKVSPYSGEVSLKGYAWSGGGRDVIRVDVSLDGGRTWAPAALSKLPHSKGPDRAWAWTLWEATLPLPDALPEGGELELVCKATDASYNTQPEDARGVWNVRGLANNSWHRVRVQVSKDAA